MKILITGATGLIGQAIAERLSEQGHELSVFHRQNSNLTVLDRHKIKQFYPGDLTDLKSLETAIEPQDHVIHCAAQVDENARCEDYWKINYLGTKNIVDLCGKFKIKGFVHMSSLGVYPRQDHHGTNELANIDMQGFDHYTKSKAHAEYYVRNFCETPYMILRPGFTYGPGDRIVWPRIMQLLKQRKIFLFGKTSQKLNHVFSKNVAQAVSQIINKTIFTNEAFNLTDLPTYTKKQFYECIAQATNTKVQFIHLPKWVAYAVCHAPPAARQVFSPNVPLSPATYKFLTKSLDFSITKAQDTLGYSPQYTLEEGLKITLRDYQSLSQPSSS